MPDPRQVRPVPAQTTCVTRPTCQVDPEEDIPSCETGPVGRYVFVFKELARLWRRRSGELR